MSLAIGRALRRTCNTVKPQTVAMMTIRRQLSSSASNPEATFEVSRPYKLHKLSSGPESTVTTTKSEMMEYYRLMTYYRRFEIVADTLYKQRLIRGFCHLYDGQEAIAAGMEAALKKGDSIITAYREHVNFLGRGGSAESCMAELLGKVTGCTKGKGGSMHMYYPQNNFYGGNGIVGAQIPVGAGVAFAHKYRKDGGVCLAMMGDGAANQGQVYEVANMAALWKLPCLFVIENNNYGMGTSTARASANPDFYTRGDYVPGIWIDGMDVLAVKNGIKFAADYARSGKGPLFVELNTYRYHGHSMSDPGISYRSRDEVSNVRAQRDCIESVKKRILEQKWASAEELKEIDKAVRAQIDKVADFAKESKEPPTSDLLADIYEGNPPPFIRMVEFEQSITNKQ